ncbi:hypothetical protein [Hymenobacter roseosalivarius]|nr:hypothetical protein [Hymenobacter roseosalivarius]
MRQNLSSYDRVIRILLATFLTGFLVRQGFSAPGLQHARASGLAAHSARASADGHCRLLPFLCPARHCHASPIAELTLPAVIRRTIQDTSLILSQPKTRVLKGYYPSMVGAF